MKTYTKIKIALILNCFTIIFTAVFCQYFLTLLAPSLILLFLQLYLLIQWRKTYVKTVELYRHYSVEEDFNSFLKLDLDAQITLTVESAWNACEQNYITQFSSKNAQLSTLQNQINPHFLYNTLDSIRWHALHSHAPEVAKMLEILAAFFRYSIDLKDSVVTVYDELNNIRDYFAIQQYRFSDRINLKIHYDTDDLLRANIPKMTLQPLVENAIFHGLEQKAKDGLVIVKIFRTQNTLYICVQDNGQGMSQERVRFINRKLENRINTRDSSHSNASDGFALWNISQRIRLFFGQDYGMHIYSTKMEGTEVVITLPWISTKQQEYY